MNKNSQDIPPLDKLKNTKNNFNDPNKFPTQNDDAFYIGVYATILNIKDELSMFKNTESHERDLTLYEKLQLILEKAYASVVSTDYQSYGFFDKDIHNDVSNVCLFFGLCLFIQETTRIPASSSNEYIYANSPKQFNKEGIIKNGYNVRNPNYIRRAPNKYAFEKTEPLTKPSANIRQYKSRLFANRAAPILGTEWRFMPKASEHEWLQYFEYIEDKSKEGIAFRDTFKRIGNLYNDLSKVLFPTDKNDNPEYDNNYLEQLQRASDRFHNKVEKLDFWNYFLLCEHSLEHIKKDTTYYGINLYRLEKELKPYTIVQEMNRLISCRDEKELNFLLNISVCLKDIPYPKIYDMLADIGDYKRMLYYTQNFLAFLRDVSRTFMLILDQFVEENLFGQDFSQFFLKTINNLAPDVLYEPIEYSHILKKATHEMHQAAFSYLLIAPVEPLIMSSIEKYARWEKAKE